MKLQDLALTYGSSVVWGAIPTIILSQKGSTLSLVAWAVILLPPLAFYAWIYISLAVGYFKGW